MSFIYYFIFFLLVVSSIIEFSKNNKISKIWYYTVVAFMIFIAGLGYAMSPDWYAYFNTFRLLLDVDWSDLGYFGEMAGMETGFIRLNKLLGYLGFDYGMVTLVMVTVALLLKSTTFYKYGGLPFLVLFIYAMPNFMFEEHIHIRQGMANAIAIYSVRYIIDRKLWSFLLCIIIGYQFHESIIVFILAYWIAVLKFDEVMIGWLVTIAIIGNYTGLTAIVEIIMQFMPVGQDKFEDYQSHLMNGESGIAVGDIVKILSVLSVMIYNKYAVHDRLYCIFRNLFIFGVLLYFFLGKSIFGIRLPGVYLVFLGLTLGRMIYNFEGSNFKRGIVYFSFVFYTLLLIFWFQIKQGDNSFFSQYNSVLNPGTKYGLWIK